MTKTLEMVFRDSLGKENILRLVDPKDGLTQADAKAAMDLIVAKNIFSTKNGDLVEAVEARIRTLETAELV